MRPSKPSGWSAMPRRTYLATHDTRAMQCLQNSRGYKQHPENQPGRHLRRLGYVAAIVLPEGYADQRAKRREVLRVELALLRGDGLTGSVERHHAYGENVRIESGVIAGNQVIPVIAEVVDHPDRSIGGYEPVAQGGFTHAGTPVEAATVARGAA